MLFLSIIIFRPHETTLAFSKCGCLLKNKVNCLNLESFKRPLQKGNGGNKNFVINNTLLLIYPG